MGEREKKREREKSGGWVRERKKESDRGVNEKGNGQFEGTLKFFYESLLFISFPTFFFRSSFSFFFVLSFFFLLRK